MKSFFRLKSLIWLLLFACLLLGAGARSRLVLCFGSDGHVALEASEVGVCGSSSNASVETIGFLTSLKSQSRADHCGPCVDIPFFLSVANDQKVKLNNPTLLVTAPVAIAPSPTFVLGPNAPNRTVSILRPTQNIVLANRRTIVLLI